MNKIAISIPTYNRPEKLLDVLNAILDQAHIDKFIITIVDNASSVDIEKYLKDNTSTKIAISVYRNIENIGLGPNLIRAIELSDADWIWLLGDDDIPKHNALEIIYNKIRIVDENSICLIKFNSEAGKELANDFLINGSTMFANVFKDPKLYSNLLFISNSIFNGRLIRQELRNMYKYAGSMAPHVPAIVSMIEKSYSIQWFTERITEHGRPQNIEEHWDFHLLRSGFLQFSDIDFSDTFIEVAMPHINGGYLGNFFKAILLLPFKTRRFSYGYWKRHYFKMASIYTGWRMLYIISYLPILYILLSSNYLYLLLNKHTKMQSGNLNRS